MAQRDLGTCVSPGLPRGGVTLGPPWRLGETEQGVGPHPQEAWAGLVAGPADPSA